jgi:hypothetical protein
MTPDANGKEEITPQMKERCREFVSPSLYVSEGHHKCAECMTLTRAGPVVGRGFRGRLR